MRPFIRPRFAPKSTRVVQSFNSSSTPTPPFGYVLSLVMCALVEAGVPARFIMFPLVARNLHDNARACASRAGPPGSWTREDVQSYRNDEDVYVGIEETIL